MVMNCCRNLLCLHRYLRQTLRWLLRVTVMTLCSNKLLRYPTPCATPFLAILALRCRLRLVIREVSLLRRHLFVVHVGGIATLPTIKLDLLQHPRRHECCGGVIWEAADAGALGEGLHLREVPFGRLLSHAMTTSYEGNGRRRGCSHPLRQGGQAREKRRRGNQAKRSHGVAEVQTRNT